MKPNDIQEPESSPKATLKSIARNGPTSPKKRRRLPNFNVEANRSTGHPLVDKFGCLRLQGFIHDRNWLFHPDLQSPDSKRGKVNLAHSIIWAFLVDRYRPIKKLDPETGGAYYEKKFGEAMFTTTYSRLARLLGFSESQVRKAIAHFRTQKLIGWEEAPEARAADKNEKPFRVWPIPDKVREVTGRGAVSSVVLADHLSTTNWVCDELAQIKIQGNVIDYNWLGHPYFLNERGLTNPLLLLVYAELFFLHTPTYPIDPDTHAELKPHKKFDNEVLYKGYLSWKRESGLTDSQLREAVAAVKVELAQVEFGPIFDRRGDLTNNKVLIALDIDAALEVTYGTKRAVRPTRKVVSEKAETGQETEKTEEKSGLRKSGGRSPESRDRAPESRDRAPEDRDRALKSGDIHSSNHYSVPQSDSAFNPHQNGDFESDKGHNLGASRVGDLSIDNEKSKPQKNAGKPKSENAILPGALYQSGAAKPVSAIWLRDQILNLALLQGLTLDDESAAIIAADLKIAGRAATAFSSDEIFGLLTRDRSRVGLDDVVSAAKAREMAYKETEKARWYLTIWPLFPEFKPDCFDGKTDPPTRTSCFVRRFNQEQSPPSTWLEDAIIEQRRAKWHAERAQQRAAAHAVMQTLNSAQMTAFRGDMIEKSRYETGSVDAAQEKWTIQLLTDESYVAALREIKDAPPVERAAAPPTATPTASGTNELSAREAYIPSPVVELATMEMQAGKFARLIRKGEMDLDAAEDDAIGRLFYPVRKAALLREMIETVMAEEAIGKAA